MTTAKKLGLSALLVLLPAVEAAAARLSFRAGASYFLPSDKVFRDIYGGGTSYGAELALSLGRRWEAWLSASLFQKTGRLTFTGEETEIRLIPVLAGARFFFARARLQPYLGLGAGYISYNETSPLGRSVGGSLGLVGQAGFIVAATSWLSLNARLSYSYGRTNPEGLAADLGGLEVSLGLGFGLSPGR
jgi:hypothetical protein